MAVCKDCGRPIRWQARGANNAIAVDTQLRTVLLSNGQVVRGYELHSERCTRRPPGADELCGQLWQVAKTKFPEDSQACLRVWMRHVAGLELDEVRQMATSEILRLTQRLEAHILRPRETVKAQWFGQLRDLDLDHDAAYHWAHKFHGWVFDPVKGRASIKLTPVMLLEGAIAQMRVMTRDEAAAIEHAYALALDDMREDLPNENRG